MFVLPHFALTLEPEEMQVARHISRNAAGEVTEAEITVRGKMAKLIAGELDISEMDDEELARGYFKDKNGRFTGRPPRAIPRELHDRMFRELMDRGVMKYREAYLDSIGVLVGIAKNRGAEDKDRIRAANLVIERLAGKVPERVEVGTMDPWQQILDSIVAEVPDTAVVEGKVVPKSG